MTPVRPSLVRAMLGTGKVLRISCAGIAGIVRLNKSILHLQSRVSRARPFEQGSTRREAACGVYFAFEDSRSLISLLVGPKHLELGERHSACEVRFFAGPQLGMSETPTSGRR